MGQVTIRGLNHRYKTGVQALRDVNLDIGAGIFGLLGPNGAGKTTMIRILITLLKPTDGRVEVDGLEIGGHRGEIRRRIGYLPQEFSTFSRLKTWEFLDYIARLRAIGPKSRRRALVEKVLEDVGLYEARDRRAMKLSGGMKRRLGIAQTLLGDPDILVIDEPTVGLDPEERVRFRNLLSDLARRDKVILLSTHIVGDISSTCSHIALLREGRVAFDGPPEDLTARARGRTWKTTVAAMDLDGIKSRYSVISTVPSNGGFEVRLVAGRFDDGPAEAVEPNLEDAYVDFMRSTDESPESGSAGEGGW
ncbi:MAG: ABC transporter ATP-binding protein [Candidatus Aminicenantes bacterium]|nr:ABC transporter ATP-binding protein [Candidatus Aminicenantes bacterium]